MLTKLSPDKSRNYIAWSKKVINPTSWINSIQRELVITFTGCCFCCCRGGSGCGNYLDVIPSIPEVFFGRDLYPISCHPRFLAALNFKSANKIKIFQVEFEVWVFIRFFRNPSVVLAKPCLIDVTHHNVRTRGSNTAVYNYWRVI